MISSIKTASFFTSDSLKPVFWELLQPDERLREELFLLQLSREPLQETALPLNAGFIAVVPPTSW